MKTLLTIGLTLALLASAATAQVTADDIRRDAAASEREIYQQRTNEAVTVSLQVGFETTVAVAEQKLAGLKRADDALRQRIESLMNSDRGRLVAADRSAFWEVLTLETRPLIQDFEFAEHGAAITRMAAAISEHRARGTGTAGAAPTVDALFRARNAQVWAETKLDAVARITRVLDSVFEDRPEDAGIPSELPSLRESLNEEIAARARRENRLIEAAEARAREDVTDVVEENAYNAALMAELQRAEQKAREMEARLDRQRAEFEERLRAMQIETKTKEAMAQIQHDRELAELKAETERMAAEIRLFAAQQAAATEKVDLEAERTRLVAKAKRPETQAVLAPLLAPGYWQPGDRKDEIGVLRQPMSYSKLVSFGAVSPTAEGLGQLIAVVNERGFSAQKSGVSTSRGGNHHDTVRPKLSLGTNWGQIDDKEREELAAMQALLRELGPTLVELDMLAP